MTPPSTTGLFNVIEATWPAACIDDIGAWRIRDGAGGGQRVSAATALNPEAALHIAAMEAAQAKMGQPPLVMVRPGEEPLNIALADAGYAVGDPTGVLLGRTKDILGPNGNLAAYPTWPPFAVQEELWAAGGIGSERIAVMARVRGPRTALMGRLRDEPVATAFVAVSDGTAMLHALEVAPKARRSGVGMAMMRAAASWSADVGAEWMAVLVVDANAPANALYRSLGMDRVAQYHYRRGPGNSR